jgi:hypothetical protein
VVAATGKRRRKGKINKLLICKLLNCGIKNSRENVAINIPLWVLEVDIWYICSSVKENSSLPISLS